MIAELTALLGAEKVTAAEEILASHSADKWNASAKPEVVVLAQCTEDVSKTLAFANQRGIPVSTRGAGIGYVGGCVPTRGGIVLSVFNMNRILDVAPEDGVIVAQPGVITADLAAAAAERGWYYPPDPASLKECSIGGNIATNAGGPRCLKYGVTRNYVLGLEVVLADGRVLRTGGRNHKNKTGFDLIGLFTGSEGLLGVVTEATLRIIPAPPTRAMVSATFPLFSDAARAVQEILGGGILPSALEITDGFTLTAARTYLGDDALPEGNSHLIVEIDGQTDSVASELQALVSRVRELGAIELQIAETASDCEKIWKLRRDFSYSLRATGLTKLNEDVVVPRSKLVELVKFASDIEAKTGIAVACFGHAGDGNIHTNLMVTDYNDPIEREKADTALDQLFQWIIANGGAITGEHGVGIAKKRWFRQAVGETSYQVHQQLKQALDPNNILNPDKVV